MKIDQDPDISTMSEGNSTHLQLQQIIFFISYLPSRNKKVHPR